MAGIQKFWQKLVDRAYYLSSPTFRLEEPSGNSHVREQVEPGNDETAASKMRHPGWRLCEPQCSDSFSQQADASCYCLAHLRRWKQAQCKNWVRNHDL